MLCWPYARIALKMTILLAHNPMVSVRALKGGCNWKNQLFRVRDRPPVVPLYVDARAAQTFPRPHGGFDEPGVGDERQPVGRRYRRCRRDGPGERARVDRRHGERREGVGELPRLPLATVG